MPSETVEISLVVATLGRTVQLDRLFESLARQDFTDFEVIVVDQNPDDRLEYLFKRSFPFPLSRHQREIFANAAPDRSLQRLDLGHRMGHAVQEIRVAGGGWI
jgi:GT2 family glycosyltransferase